MINRIVMALLLFEVNLSSHPWLTPWRRYAFTFSTCHSRYCTLERRLRLAKTSLKIIDGIGTQQLSFVDLPERGAGQCVDDDYQLRYFECCHSRTESQLNFR